MHKRQTPDLLQQTHVMTQRHPAWLLGPGTGTPAAAAAAAAAAAVVESKPCGCALYNGEPAAVPCTMVSQRLCPVQW
jgi:hypothetical protein